MPLNLCSIMNIIPFQISKCHTKAIFALLYNMSLISRLQTEAELHALSNHIPTTGMQMAGLFEMKNGVRILFDYWFDSEGSFC